MLRLEDYLNLLGKRKRNKKIKATESLPTGHPVFKVFLNFYNFWFIDFNLGLLVSLEQLNVCVVHTSSSCSKWTFVCLKVK